MTKEFERFNPEEEHLTRDGERIDQDLIDTLSAIAEESGPPSGLIPGGKSLSGQGKHSPRIQVVLSEQVAEEVRERAEAEDMSVSRWVRRLVENEVR
ncbi:hypothetical protein [Ancrocorticia populi]|nr:hypothetical protein [Ancrocorticia populi]